MKILVVQEVDWVNKNPVLHHHIIEHLSRKGHKILVIDYENEWKRKNTLDLFSKTRLIKNYCKIYKDTKLDIYRPWFVKMGIVCFLSIFLSHTQGLKKIIKSFKPDVILLYSLINCVQTIKTAKKQGVPVIFHSMDVLYKAVPYKFLEPVAFAFEKWLYKNSSYVVAISEGLKKYATKMGASAENIKIIPPPVILKRFNPKINGKNIREEYGIKRQEILLLFTGYLYNFVGLGEVIKTFQHLPDNVKLLIVGDGPFMPKLKKLAKKEERVIIAGQIPYQRIPAFISACDIGIIPFKIVEATRHVIPSKIVEYLACGKPIVMTSLPSVKKLYGRKGIIYAENPSEITLKVKNLLEKKGFKELGKKGVGCAKKFSLDKVTKDFEKTLQLFKR